MAGGSVNCLWRVLWARANGSWLLLWGCVWVYGGLLVPGKRTDGGRALTVGEERMQR